MRRMKTPRDGLVIPVVETRFLSFSELGEGLPEPMLLTKPSMEKGATGFVVLGGLELSLAFRLGLVSTENALRATAKTSGSLPKAIGGKLKSGLGHND